MIKTSKRGQRRRTKVKREKAINPPKYSIGTILVKELIAKEDMIGSDGKLIKKGKKYFQSYKEMR